MEVLPSGACGNAIELGTNCHPCCPVEGAPDENDSEHCIKEPTVPPDDVLVEHGPDWNNTAVTGHLNGVNTVGSTTHLPKDVAKGVTSYYLTAFPCNC